jgi:hypothetical protein
MGGKELGWGRGGVKDIVWGWGWGWEGWVMDPSNDFQSRTSQSLSQSASGLICASQTEQEQPRGALAELERFCISEEAAGLERVTEGCAPSAFGSKPPLLSVPDLVAVHISLPNLKADEEASSAASST